MGVLVCAHVALTVVAIPLALIDLREHRLPDRLTLPLCGFSAVAALSQLGLGGAQERVIAAVMASALVVSLLWCAAEAPGKPLGFGDVKLGGALSVQMGWYGIEWALWSMSRGQIGPRDSIPFGPWMLIGAIVVLLRVA